jgi:hypothetical protein
MKKGVTILADHPGNGRPLQPGDRVRLRCLVQLHHGDYVVRGELAEFTLGDRQHVAGFRYASKGCASVELAASRPAHTCATETKR